MSGEGIMLSGVTLTGKLVQAWEPIDTAPKDGSYVLLFGPDGIDFGQYSVLGAWKRFQTAEWDNEMADISAPTHWMPAPLPPN